MEIGSIFEIDPEILFKETKGNFHLPYMNFSDFSYHQLFNTGRSSIEFLLTHLKKNNSSQSILIPSFNCSSVVDAVKRSGNNFNFYSITEDLRIDIDNLKSNIDDNVKIIYVIHYFGMYQDSFVYDFLKELQKNGIIIIEDISLSLYTSHQKFIGFGDYVLGSIRKWLPIPDGGFLSSNEDFNNNLIENSYNEFVFKYFAAQIMKHKYIENPKMNKEDFLELNSEAMDTLFSDFTIREITSVSKRYLQSYDMYSVKQKRLDNYQYLLRESKTFRFIKPFIINKKGEIPFGFVVLSEKRNKLREHLIKNNIYCNIHWITNTECNNFDERTKYLSDKILTIPCDQRYGKKEMNYILNVLDSFS